MKVVEGLVVIAGGFLGWQLWQLHTSTVATGGGGGAAPPRKPRVDDRGQAGVGDEAPGPRDPVTVSPPPPKSPVVAGNAALVASRRHASIFGHSDSPMAPKLSPHSRDAIAKATGWDPVTGQRARGYPHLSNQGAGAVGNSGPPVNPTGPGPGGTRMGDDDW
jgi:hypothetical protein